MTAMGEKMAAGGENRWQYLGRNQSPLTRSDPALLVLPVYRPERPVFSLPRAPSFFPVLVVERGVCKSRRPRARDGRGWAWKEAVAAVRAFGVARIAKEPG